MLDVRQAGRTPPPLLYLKMPLCIAPEQHPITHTHVTGTALKLPFVDRVVCTRTPYEIAPLALALLATVWIGGIGGTQAIRFIVQSYP